MPRPTETEFTHQIGRFFLAHKDVWRPKTYAIYGHVYRCHLEPRFKGQSINTITPNDLQVAINNREHAAATRRLTKSFCVRFWNWLIENDLAFKNPAKHVRIARVESLPKEALTIEQGRAVLEAARADWSKYLYPFVGIGLYTGLRRMNILQLGPGVIFNDRLVFQGTLMKTGNPLQIPYRPELKPLLDLCPLNVDRNGISRGFDRIRKATGLSFLTPHTLRRTFATWMFKFGAPFPTIRKLMGHARIDASMTAIYTTVDMDQMREALKVLPLLL
ncbi:MAG: tyrosine-type recombinase/integrase [bacterium]